MCAYKKSNEFVGDVVVCYIFRYHRDITARADYRFSYKHDYFWELFKHCSFPREQPLSRYTVIFHQMGEPCYLEQISVHFLFQRMEIPIIDVIPSGKRLFSSNGIPVYQSINSIKKTLYYFLACGALHFSFAALKRASVLLFFLSSRVSHPETISGLN